MINGRQARSTQVVSSPIPNFQFSNRLISTIFLIPWFSNLHQTSATRAISGLFCSSHDSLILYILIPRYPNSPLSWFPDISISRFPISQFPWYPNSLISRFPIIPIYDSPISRLPDIPIPRYPQFPDILIFYSPISRFPDTSIFDSPIFRVPSAPNSIGPRLLGRSLACVILLSDFVMLRFSEFFWSQTPLDIDYSTLWCSDLLSSLGPELLRTSATQEFSGLCCPTLCFRDVRTCRWPRLV